MKVKDKDDDKKLDQRCDSCNISGSERLQEVASVQGTRVIRCVDPVACRLTAQIDNRWLG